QLQSGVSFIVTGWVRGQIQPSNGPQAMWLQPPPLSLPDNETCTQPSDAEIVVAASPKWTPATVKAHLDELAGDHPEVDIVDVDCEQLPCIAWLYWAEGLADPDLAYRWWSLESERGGPLWTASRTFEALLPDSPDGMLQAVSIAITGDDEEVSGGFAPRIDGRVHELRERLGQ
ncbi:MAG: hypothetical protein AAF602_13555, partial [Myxococcota bacterium]